MAISEHARHRMYQRLEQLLGEQEATTLMEHLPPVGWADVATKTDLHALADRIDARFEAVGLRIEASEHSIRAELQRDLRLQGYAIVAALSAVMVAVSTAGRLV
jgi:hypothetical protein